MYCQKKVKVEKLIKEEVIVKIVKLLISTFITQSLCNIIVGLKITSPI